MVEQQFQQQKLCYVLPVHCLLYTKDSEELVVLSGVVKSYLEHKLKSKP